MQPPCAGPGLGTRQPLSPAVPVLLWLSIPGPAVLASEGPSAMPGEPVALDRCLKELAQGCDMCGSS